MKDVGIEISEEMKEGKVVIDVFTVWCGPCKFISPVLEKLRDEGLFKLMKVDLDKNRALGEMFGITAIPTLMFFKDGELLNNSINIQGQAVVNNGIMVGAAGEPVIRQIVEQM